VSGSLTCYSAPVPAVSEFDSRARWIVRRKRLTRNDGGVLDVDTVLGVSVTRIAAELLLLDLSKESSHVRHGVAHTE